MILIATNARDLTSDFVALELERRAIEFYRLNTETLAEALISYNPKLGEDGWSVEYSDGKSINFYDVKAGYLRRPEMPSLRFDVADEVQRQYCSSEWGTSLVSALRSLDRRWLNSPISMLVAENKPKQLAIALELGFAVPETLVTNNPDVVREFVERGPSIGKPLSSSLFGSGNQERVVFTNRLNVSEVVDRHDIEVAPFILQREVIKRCDLRITVVGHRVFAAEIHSQGYIETETDWRKGSRVDLPHTEHHLPSSVADMCIRLTSCFDLRFSAIDMVLDVDGKYWFMEINPNGQWAWIEKRLGAKISEAIVDELEGIANA